MNSHSCNPSPPSTSSTVKKTTFAEWNWIHSAKDTDDTDKWVPDQRMRQKEKHWVKPINITYFWKGWKWQDMSGAIEANCRDRCTKTLTNQTSHWLSCQEAYGEGPKPFCLHFKVNKKLYFNFRVGIWKIEHYSGRPRCSCSPWLTHHNECLCQHQAWEMR